jgi:hypothetical protein
MTTYELTNNQRKYFDSSQSRVIDRVLLKGDTYRPESILYFDGDIIKRHIVSTQTDYFEKQYNDLTKTEQFFYLKLKKGKRKTNSFRIRTTTTYRCLFEHLSPIPDNWEL